MDLCRQKHAGMLEKWVRELFDIDGKYVLFGWILRRTNTVNVIWRLSSFTGGGRPHEPLLVLFQARAGT